MSQLNQAIAMWAAERERLTAQLDAKNAEIARLTAALAEACAWGINQRRQRYNYQHGGFSIASGQAIQSDPAPWEAQP